MFIAREDKPVESVEVYQCPNCLRIRYATTEVDHDYFFVGEVLEYATPEVCATCAFEIKERQMCEARYAQEKAASVHLETAHLNIC